MGVIPRPAPAETAERELGRDYERLKPEVLRTVRSKLRAVGIGFDDADMEGFYNLAWHAVYVKLQAGEDILNRTGLLVSIVHRRALDEHRALQPGRRATPEELERSSVDPDFAARLDDEVRVRRLIEAMRDGLNRRERQAAALCYLHDYSRASAAKTMGISPRRMEKLMDGVSKKFSVLSRDVARGDWCEGRRSLIKA